MMGIMFGVSLVYLIRNEFMINPLIIITLIIIAIALSEWEIHLYDKYLKNGGKKDGIQLPGNRRASI